MILKDEIINEILVIKQNRAVSTLKKVFLQLKSYNIMKNKKKLEVLFKVIQRIYDKNPGMQEMIGASMKDVSADEGVSPEQVFFILLLSLS